MKTTSYYQTTVFIMILTMTISCSNSIDFKSTEPLGAKGAESPSPEASQGIYTAAKENFTQSTNRNQVDILFIDDNSVSMSKEQEEMANKFPTFIKSLSDVRWQIGVTTTDHSSALYALKGALLDIPHTGGQKILDPILANSEKLFSETVRRPETLNCDLKGGTCPSGDEQPLKSIIEAVAKRGTENAGFFRDEASLAVVVLSDEDELSERPANATSPQQVIDAIKTAWPKGKNFAVYGVIIQPGDSNCLDLQNTQGSGKGYYGTAVAELSKLTGGITGSICASDYSPILKKIGDSVYQLSSAFELANEPVPGTVQVEFDPQQNIAWKVAEKRIIFQTPPSWDTKITVNYKYKKSKSTKNRGEKQED